ncbi:mono-functional DNA-alkylating methyl methanesulfonate N-term-domain-containing protein [Xylariaceae sp. FL0016]|nr:mono-functional DNA-alkylating methyl methanesulfonate N-term-domain-containing protein [Xylariaceae sp. FL0016]
MASIQSYVLEDGQWVLKNVSTNELMQQGSPSRRTLGNQALPKPPNFGILTNTVVESPIVRWVLPCQFRNRSLNDVVFVGDYNIHVCELNQNNQLIHLMTKNDFGSRIRNALVLGTPHHAHVPNEDSAYDDDDLNLDQNKPESRYGQASVPEQFLVLVLEDGDLVFICLRESPQGDWEFDLSCHNISSQRLVNPGFHMAVDPSWHYLTIACAESLFIMIQIHPLNELQRRYLTRQPLNPVRETYGRAASGIILKIDFLHPSHGNNRQVILLIIMVQAAVSKLAIYEWEHDDSLEGIFREEASGHRLADAYQMPLLIAPLKVNTAFLIVTESTTAVCVGALSDTPRFEPFQLTFQPNDYKATSLHHGRGEPRWTAWTRPIRHVTFYQEGQDAIYLAREDGLIGFLDFKEKYGIETSTALARVECNIDTAFAAPHERFGDLILAGGDMGPGAIWNVMPRQHPKRIGSSPNWAPTVDFAVVPADTTTEGLANGPLGRALFSGTPLDQSLSNLVLQPDRIFTCSGRGVMGGISEIRSGIEAKIGLDLTYSSPIKQCWAFPSHENSIGDGFLMLLSLPNASAILHIAQDMSEVAEKFQNESPFDLSSTTLALYTIGDTVVQITSNRITIIHGSECYQHWISDVIGDPTMVVTDAAIYEDVVALAVHSGPKFNVITFNLAENVISLEHKFEIEGEVSFLTVEKLAGKNFAIACVWQSRGSSLVFYPTGSSQSLSNADRLNFYDAVITDHSGFPLRTQDGEDLGALTSITAIEQDEKGAMFAAGTRGGGVLTFHIDFTQAPSLERLRWVRLGEAPCHVFEGSASCRAPSVLVCNDTELIKMTKPRINEREDWLSDVFRIWPTDASESNMPSPPINSVAKLHQNLGLGSLAFAMISGARILITQLQPHPTTVPRFIPLEGTPSRMMYCQRLDALAVVVVKRGISSLHFIDPKTGMDLSHPVDSSDRHRRIDHIRGLGVVDARVMSLIKWHFNVEGVTREWLVIAMRVGQYQGSLALVCTEQDNFQTSTGVSRRVRFWTHFRHKVKDGPIGAVTTDEGGIFLCAGNSLQYHAVVENKFKMRKHHDLPSPATSMQLVGGKLHVLTAKHSLIILDYSSKATEMEELHTDDITRTGLHSIEVGTFGNDGQRQSISVISDPMCGVYGLWAPSQTERPFKLIFQAELQNSVRKFARGQILPPWWSALKNGRYGCIETERDDGEVLGLSINGSLQHFTFINEDVWRLLRYIQNAATICSVTHPNGINSMPARSQISDDPEPDADPKVNMHVDGDILRRCLNRRILEKLFENPVWQNRLHELSGRLFDGDLDTRIPRTNEERHPLADAYDILRYYVGSLPSSSPT